MIIKYKIFRGPNLHAPRRLIWISIDFTGAAPAGDARLRPAFMEALFAHIPALRDDPQLTAAAGAGEQLICQALLATISFALDSTGHRITLREFRHTDTPGLYNILLDYMDEQIAAAAAALATRLFHQLVQHHVDPSVSANPDFSFAREYDAFVTFAENRKLNRYNQLIVDEADKRGIPWHKVGQDTVHLGQGRYQRRFTGNYTERTSLLSVQTSSNKYVTNQLLRESCLPIPRQRTVANKHDAVRAAKSLGFPVVVKPMSADRGLGVAVGLDTTAEVETGYENAQKFSQLVIVETFIPGNDYRLVVIDGKFVAAAQRVHAHILGDGRATVAELVERENIRRQPKPSEQWSLNPLALDDEADRFLTKVGMTRTSIPEAGRQVFLRGTANLKTGGTSINVTDQVHPDIRSMAVDAAAAVGLDIAGIDYLTPDIGRSNQEVGGAICEVNCRPSPRVHIMAGGDGLNRIISAQVDYLFPEGSPTRISTIAVLGGELGTLSAQMIADVLNENGRTTGVASENKILIKGNWTTNHDMSSARTARNLLRHPKIDAAILDVTARDVIEEGLFTDRVTVSVLAEPLGNGPTTPSEISEEAAATVRRLVIDAADSAVVLSANNPLCRDVINSEGRKRVCIVAASKEDEGAREFISAGHAVVTQAVLNGKAMITVHAGGNAEPVIEIDRMAPTAGASDTIRGKAAMYAVALCHIMGISPVVTRRALAAFKFTAKP